MVAKRKLTQTTRGYVLGTGELQGPVSKLPKLDDDDYEPETDTSSDDSSDSASVNTTASSTDSAEEIDELGVLDLFELTEEEIEEDEQEAEAFLSDTEKHISDDSEDDGSEQDTNGAQEARAGKPGSSNRTVSAKVFEGAGIQNENALANLVHPRKDLEYSGKKAKGQGLDLLEHPETDAKDRMQSVNSSHGADNWASDRRSLGTGAKLTSCLIGGLEPTGTISWCKDETFEPYVTQGWHPNCGCKWCLQRKLKVTNNDG
ncbi:hypothetical protein OPT61_g79 [Boeremia exigua]|uniref:Uncharacterized protein n=1 Tax=Boeremia exigua TaxID=749465 RepID=A0ACC2IVI8_9PLEO|nr:hypothetical protein OPT61_g79 [Boeremia exigua]